MPRDIKVKLCILTWKEFWKNYVPLIARPPSWLKYHNYVQKSLWNAK